MRRAALIVVTASLIWGNAFAHGASAKARKADAGNLVKARAAEGAIRKANGDSAGQAAAARASLVKARAVRAAERKAVAK